MQVHLWKFESLQKRQLEDIYEQVPLPSPLILINNQRTVKMTNTEVWEGVRWIGYYS
jgi:hypothetical protein